MKKPTDVKVSSEDFALFEEARMSGLVNMCDLTKVSNLTGLSKQKVKQIICDYDRLRETFSQTT